MKVDLLDLINIIMIFQLLIFTAFLLGKKKHHISDYFLGIHLFAQAAGIYTTLSFMQYEFFYVENPHFVLIGYPFVFLWGPTFYFYVKTVAYKDFKLKWIHSVHIILFLIFLIFFCFTFYFYSPETKRIILNDPAYTFFSNRILIDAVLRLQVLFYIIKANYILFNVRDSLKSSYSSISKSNFSWLGFIVIGYTICFIISITFIYLEFYLDVFSRYIFLGNFLQFFIFFNIIFFKGWAQPEIFHRIDEKSKYKSSRLSKDESVMWIDKLNADMAEKKYYLNPDLTLEELAGNLDIPPRILSQVINEYFRNNFYDYINKLRIEESKRMIADASCKKSILEILYDAGFNSKATFNRVFKKETGLTPTEYRNKFYSSSVAGVQN